MFTHHQKTIILDGASPTGGPRQLISFVGGLDLCDGRYDTGDHHLFKTCCEGGPHCNDMHQACIEGEGLEQGFGNGMVELMVSARLVSVMKEVGSTLGHLLFKNGCEGSPHCNDMYHACMDSEGSEQGSGMGCLGLWCLQGLSVMKEVGSAGDRHLFKTCCEWGPHCSDMHQACIEGKEPGSGNGIIWAYGVCKACI